MRQAPVEFKGTTLGSGPNAIPADGKAFAVAAENTHKLGI
jgi:hypothetical protein